MILKANQKYIDTSSISHLLVKGENNADTIMFQVDKFYNNTDLSNCEFILRTVNENQEQVDEVLIKQINDNHIYLIWKVNEYFTAVNGRLLIEIRAISENLILKYVMQPIYVKNSINGDGLPSLDIIEKAINDMQKLLAQAQNVSSIVHNENFFANLKDENVLNGYFGTYQKMED